MADRNASAPRVHRPQAPRRIVRSQVPPEIADDPKLKAAMAALPPNYELEIPKTVWRARQLNARCVALQMPEGLLLFATTIVDILERFTPCGGPDGRGCIILGDPTYGACCIDDATAVACGADLLVHYGHSCLVPLDKTLLPCLYIFVTITIDVPHLVETVKANFNPSARLLVAGTIQFAPALRAARAALQPVFASVTLPQSHPLSPGEVLGCTAPSIPATSADALIFVSDGRFHLEAMMIANPSLPAYRYDPYSRTITKEGYDHKGFRAARRAAVQKASSARKWGVVQGTLGRQGNDATVERIISRLCQAGCTHIHFLVAELTPAKVAAVGADVEAWVQVACPRLSIDWGDAFSAPMLTSYELEVALGFVPAWWVREGGGRGEEGSRERGARGEGVSITQGGRGKEGVEAQADRHSEHEDSRERACSCSTRADSGAPPCCQGASAADSDSVQQCAERGSPAEASQAQPCSTCTCARAMGGDTEALHGASGARQDGGKDTMVLVSPNRGGQNEELSLRIGNGSEESMGVADLEMSRYPMDYYARDGGPWNSAYVKPVTRHAGVKVAQGSG